MCIYIHVYLFHFTVIYIYIYILLQAPIPHRYLEEPSHMSSTVLSDQYEGDWDEDFEVLHAEFSLFKPNQPPQP